ncbi:hypothetical protein GA0070616_5174 [Micromonospora nigra]|uniref:Uncharacterized protein n=1 Tax=Micromonospora nigra TaxID=145857 RepID=A0A1C6T0A5_9ACTN|nr:hypothetical protein [Micromonospora nigra]SCL35236.1 hypothetical protein GA0070616_5174 [Micromonospora nigra]
MSTTFPFRFDPRYRPALALLGVRPSTARVVVGQGEVRVRFGPWRVRADLADVVAVEPGGPYRWWKVIGPHLSLADGGVTFGTSVAAGVCLRFRRPVPALLPGGLLRHPGVTVTVADPPALTRALTTP